MAQQKPSSAHPGKPPTGEALRGDPWHAFGYLVGGVFMYGLIGWALDRWLGTSFLVMIGILAGAGLGIYMTWARFNKADAHGTQEQQS